MNNLFRIPGIVCQGDDGRFDSEPKQTDSEHTAVSSEVFVYMRVRCLVVKKRARIMAGR